MNEKYLPILKDAQNWCDEQDKSFGFSQAYLADQLQAHFPNVTYEDAQEIALDFLIGEWW